MNKIKNFILDERELKVNQKSARKKLESSYIVNSSI
jgi:uncharacterized membrane protein